MPKPLKIDKFLADPCSMLPQSQLTSFDLSQPRKREDSVGISCDWKFKDGYTRITAAFPTSVKDGLTNAYRQKSFGYYDHGYFEPTTINGFPALFADPSDHRDQGQISVTIGVSDTSVLLVFVQGMPGTNAKTAAKNTAEAVLSTMQGGQ